MNILGTKINLHISNLYNSSHCEQTTTTTTLTFVFLGLFIGPQINSDSGWVRGAYIFGSYIRFARLGIYFLPQHEQELSVSNYRPYYFIFYLL